MSKKRKRSELAVAAVSVFLILVSFISIRSLAPAQEVDTRTGYNPYRSRPPMMQQAVQQPMAAARAFSAPANPATLSPSEIRDTLRLGESGAFHSTLHLPAEAMPPKTDIMIAIDVSGSMFDEYFTIASESRAVMDTLSALFPEIRFGLITHIDYPYAFTSCGYSDQYGDPTAYDFAYNLNAPFTYDRGVIGLILDTIYPGSGMDLPEDFTRVLYESYADTAIHWRPEAKRILLSWGDDIPHDCNAGLDCTGPGLSTGGDPGRDGILGTPDDLDLAAVLSELKARNIRLIAVHSGAQIDLWNCYVSKVGGAAFQINNDGTIPSGLSIAGFIASILKPYALLIDTMKLACKTPGYAGWVQSISPTQYTGIDCTLERDLGFDVEICVPAGTPEGEYSFELCALGDGVPYATQTVTVMVKNEANPPVPDLDPLPVLSGECCVDVTMIPTATAANGTTIYGTTTDPLSYNAQGTYFIIWHYDDGSGNDTTQQQYIIIQDITPPAPDIDPLPVITGQCNAAVTSYPTATDNCSGTLVATTSNLLAYDAQGVYTVTWDYDDGNGNSSSQQQTVIVEDNTAPVPNNATLPVTTGECMVLVSSVPYATDNCMGLIAGVTDDPLTYTAQGRDTITWRYDDGNGNISFQKQIIIVDDNAPPVPDLNPLPAIVGQCSTKVTVVPTATDNCSGPVAGMTTDSLSYWTKGVRTVTWRYDDGNGNSATQTQMVVVTDDCCPEPQDSAYNYGIVAEDIVWNGTGACTMLGSAIQANGSFTMNGSNIFHAGIFSSVKIRRVGSSMIDGDATAPVIEEAGSGMITGLKTIRPVQRVSIPVIDFTPYRNYAAERGMVAAKNVKWTGSRDTVIPGGLLWVEGNFSLSGSMSVTGCVIATGNIDIATSGDFNRVLRMPVLASINGDIKLSGSGTVTGLVYAGNGEVVKSGSGAITGSIICKKDFKKNGSWSLLTYRKFPPFPPECE